VGDVKQPYFTNAVDITDYEGVVIDGLRGDASPTYFPVVHDGGHFVTCLWARRATGHALCTSQA
jgi:hypothetical protein